MGGAEAKLYILLVCMSGQLDPQGHSCQKGCMGIRPSLDMVLKIKIPASAGN
jgi:hypothetical protein